MCEDDICRMVKLAFQRCLLPEHINKTLIALVPKVDNPILMSNLRPISLCNTIYKIISKILVAWLRPIMSQTINPAQSSFVLGRQITDNILIVQEVLNLFRRSRGRKAYMAWKIDLSKTYDRMGWKFIMDVLWEIGIRGRVYELIKQCITTVTYQVLVNGEKIEEFKPGCGLRQGDPLSLYLFVMGMEKLSQLISVCVDAGIWKAVKVSRNGHLTHRIQLANG